VHPHRVVEEGAADARVEEMGAQQVERGRLVPQ
jgi:hypothetical protein